IGERQSARNLRSDNLDQHELGSRSESIEHHESGGRFDSCDSFYSSSDPVAATTAVWNGLLVLFQYAASKHDAEEHSLQSVVGEFFQYHGVSPSDERCRPVLYETICGSGGERSPDRV